MSTKKLQIIGGTQLGASTGAIIDVAELPVDNINEKCFYRLSATYYVSDQRIIDNSNYHIVESLPTIGLPVTNEDKTQHNMYYCLSDNKSYFYVDDATSNIVDLSIGWYSISQFFEDDGMTVEEPTIITDMKDSIYNKSHILLTYDYYIYKDGWIKTIFPHDKAPEIDATLTTENAAADAKAVRDAIDNLDAHTVPTIRTINGKQLTDDIVLTAEDIGVANIETDATLKEEGQAADAKATGDAINEINSKLEGIEDNIYIQNDEPTDAPEGSIWIDMDADGLSNTTPSSASNVYVVDAATTDITTVDFSKYSVGDVVLVTTS